MKIECIASHQNFENVGFLVVGLALDSDGDEPRHRNVAGRMVHFSVISNEIRKSKLYEAIHHHFEFRRVSAESNGRKQDEHFAMEIAAAISRAASA